MSKPISNSFPPSRLLAFALLVIAASGALDLARPAVSAQATGATLSGVVQDDRGAPVAEAKVTISSQDFSSSALTQVDGRFEFRNLKPAQYTVTAEAVRFRKEIITVTITRPDETPPPVVIKLNFSSLHVAVLDANNQPLGGVSVILYAQDRASTTRTTTDGSGDAYFGRLSPGSYQLAAALRGYEEYRNDVFISSGITTEFALKLSVAPVIPINQKAKTRLSVPNLPSKNVQAIFEDSQGWIWFGTDKGVARFNGADFTSSAAAGSPFEQLAGEDVRSITEDGAGSMWMATPRGVRRIAKDGTDLGETTVGIDTLSGREARQVMADRDGKIWIATSSGVFVFDGRVFTVMDESHGLASNDARAIAEDKTGRVWIATPRGVTVIDGDKTFPFEQLLKATTPADQGAAADQAEAQPSRPPDRAGARPRPRAGEQAPPGDRATAMSVSDASAVFIDKSGAVWLATAKGMMLFEGGLLASPSVAGLTVPPAAADASAVRAIGQDRSDRMWFALASSGAVLYDPVRRDSQRISFLDQDRVAAVFTSREGNTWFATDNGAVYADLYSFVNYTTSRGLSDNDVRAVAEDPTGGSNSGPSDLWFFTDGGVSRMVGERFVPVERFRANLSVRAVARDREGTAWLATDQGLLKLSGQTLTQINEGNGLDSNNVRWVTNIANGSAMIVATAKGASILKEGALQAVDRLAGYDIRHVFEDVDGRLWFATARGVVAFNPQTAEANSIDTTRGLADNDARWVTRFQDKLLVATRAGIQVYKPDGAGSFTNFDSEPASTLLVDREGRYLWVGTDDGQLKKFAIFGGHVVSAVYSGEVYALTGSRINSIYEDRQGQVWVATDKGAVRHIPIRVAPLTQVSLEVDGRAPLQAVGGTHTLSYGRHRVTFHFTAVSTSGPVRYLYRINRGQENQPWVLLPFQQNPEREVSRMDMGEGAHRFEVFALNRDLYGAEAPAAQLALTVGSPFWKRWWFYTLALAVIGLTAATVMAAHRIREREYILPKELRTYSPIEPNPYIVGNPIRTEKMFYGREDDFRYVRTKLEGVNQGVVIVFCGDRRVGKSSILYQVLNGRLGERFIPVFVDMQEMVIASDSEFFARISRLIAEAVASADSRRQPAQAAAVGPRLLITQPADARITVPSFDGRNPYPVFIDYLDEVLRSIGERTLLILMDEYELMEAKVDEGKLSSDLFTFLAGLMDNKERLALIFTGSRRLEERDKKYWRELLRRSLFRKVGFLSGKDAVRLITEPVRGRAVFGRGVIDATVRLTAGQPFYIQVICQNIVDYMNEHEQNWVTISDLNHVIADIVDNPLPQMIYTWDGLSDDEKLVLSLLAETLPGGEAFATSFDLHTSVRANAYPVNLSENTIRLTLEEMFHRELLDKDAADGFRFKIDLFRLWIRRSHSIWQVVKEVRTL